MSDKRNEPVPSSETANSAGASEQEGEQGINSVGTEAGMDSRNQKEKLSLKPELQISEKAEDINVKIIQSEAASKGHLALKETLENESQGNLPESKFGFEVSRRISSATERGFKISDELIVNAEASAQEESEEELIRKMKESMLKNVSKPSTTYEIERSSHETSETCKNMFISLVNTLLGQDENVDDLLTNTVEFRYATQYMYNREHLAPIYQEEIKQVFEMSKGEDAIVVTKEEYNREDRPDELRARLLGSKDKEIEQELETILNKYTIHEAEIIIKEIESLFERFCESITWEALLEEEEKTGNTGIRNVTSQVTKNRYLITEQERFLTFIFVTLYDKACLEHKFVQLYVTIIKSLIDLHREDEKEKDLKKKEAVSYFKSFGEFKKDKLLREIVSGVVFLDQYKEKQNDSEQTKLYKKNNLVLHFSGCIAFSAGLYYADKSLVTVKELLDAFYSALFKDQDNIDKKQITEQIGKLTQQSDKKLCETEIDEIVKNMLSKTEKAKFDMISLIVELLTGHFEAVKEDALLQEESRHSFTVLEKYILKLDQTTTDALVLFKREEMLKSIKIDLHKTKETRMNIAAKDWDKSKDMWQSEGLLELLCSFYRCTKEKLNAEFYQDYLAKEQSNWFSIFVGNCFEHNYALNLLKARHSYFNYLDDKSEHAVQEIIISQFFAHYETIEDPKEKNVFYDLIIAECMQENFLIYSFIEKAGENKNINVRELIKELNIRLIISSYQETLEEYEGSFDEAEVAKFEEEVNKLEFDAQYTIFSNLYQELKDCNYSYYNEPDFGPQMFEYATTPFEDLAIEKFHRIYIAKERFSDENKGFLKDAMPKLGNYYTGRLIGSLTSMMDDCHFAIGFVAFEMFSITNYKLPRQKFYNQKKLIYETITNGVELKSCPNNCESTYIELLQNCPASLALDTAYDAVKNKETGKELFAAYCRMLKAQKVIDAKVAKELIEKMNAKNERYGTYELSNIF